MAARRPTVLALLVCLVATTSTAGAQTAGFPYMKHLREAEATDAPLDVFHRLTSLSPADIG